MGIFTPSTTVPSGPFKLFQIAFAVLSCLLCAGVIFGFAALKPVLIKEGVYGQYCDSKHDEDVSRHTGRPCVGQDLQLNLAFTISVVVNNVAALPIGVILDRIGPQKTSMLGSILFAAGNIFMGLNESAAKGFDPFLIGYIFLSIGGPMIFLSCFHLCNAFPKNSGLILSALIGAFDASSLPFVVYSALYKHFEGIPLKNWFWLYTIIPALIFVHQLFTAPRAPYGRQGVEEVPETPAAAATERTPLLSDGGAASGISVRGNESGILRPHGALTSRRSSLFESSFSRVYFATDAPAILEDEDGEEPAENGSAKPRHGESDPITGILWGVPISRQISTLWFWLPQLFLTCYMLRINYEIATVYDQVLYYTNSIQLAETLTDAFVLLLPIGGVLSIPFIGFLLDKRSSMAAFIALLILGLGYGIGCMLKSVPTQLAGITMFTIMRPLMYTAISDYYTKVIGIETFGTVYGLANALSGACTLVQYPIDYTVKVVLEGDYTPVNLVFLVLGLVLATAVVLKIHFGTKNKSKERTALTAGV